MTDGNWAREVRTMAELWRADADRMAEKARELAGSDSSYVQAAAESMRAVSWHEAAAKLAALADRLEHGSSGSSCAGELSTCEHATARHGEWLSSRRYAADDMANYGYHG